MKKKFLTNALEYAESKGDGDWFCEHYCVFRKEEDIRTSTYLTLEALYGEEVAYKIESESDPSFF